MNNPYPESPYKRPLNALITLATILAICLLASFGAIAALALSTTC